MNRKDPLFVGIVFITLGLLASSQGLRGAPNPEYPASEARKHVGETAIVTGKVACQSRGRTFRLLQLEGCNASSLFDVVVRDPLLQSLDKDPDQYNGAKIAVTGKIKRFQTVVQIEITAPSQITRR